MNQPLGKSHQVQLVAGEIGLADWSNLGDLAKDEILRLRTEADAKAEKLKTGAYREEAGRAAMRRSKRRKAADKREADAVLEEAAKKSTVLLDAMKLLASSIVAFKNLKTMVDMHIPTEVWNVLAGSLKKQLDLVGISVQRYWAATLVGPDCRRFLQYYEKILQGIAADMESVGHPESECTDFVNRHTAVLKPLSTVLHLTRKTEMLHRETDMPELRDACTQFGVAWRRSFPHRNGLTPKGHIVEAHVADFVEMYGTAGVFGEDGAEAIHVSDAACRRIVRQMRNPIERHKATMLHHIAYQFTPALQRTIKKRKTAGVAETAPACDVAEVALEALNAAAAAATDTTALLMPNAPSLEEGRGATAAIADVWDPR